MPAAAPHADTTRSRRFRLQPARHSEQRSTAWLDGLESRVVSLGTGYGLDEDAAHFLGVALREALLNALRHGGSQGRISVGIRVRGERLVVTVRDRGPGFDPRDVPDPCCDENLARGCGRGIFFMRRFADRVVFSFPRSGGTRVRIEKSLTACAAPPAAGRAGRPGTAARRS
jgi:serine/threonine-protein kinase RsbW